MNENIILELNDGSRAIFVSTVLYHHGRQGMYNPFEVQLITCHVQQGT
jgi:hypothetical protein